MITHFSLGNTPFGRTKLLKQLIDEKKVCFGGNSKLKIYGLMNCKSGRRMKTANRVFFVSEEEAANNGYRPCGHCMNVAYKQWKQNHR
jgi:methylphosphotriester-DNA--protein-cysteine methyltransferase